MSSLSRVLRDVRAVEHQRALQIARVKAERVVEAELALRADAVVDAERETLRRGRRRAAHAVRDGDRGRDETAVHVDLAASERQWTAIDRVASVARRRPVPRRASVCLR